MAKVDADQYAELAKRFVPDEYYPQLLWFMHGEPTSYHRSLRKADQIVDFALALDRDPINDVQSEADVSQWNVVALVRAAEGSAMYRVAEVVAAKYMATVAFAHIQDSASTVTWYVDSKAKETYRGEADAAVLERWVQARMTVSEDAPDNPVDADGVTIVVGNTFEDVVFSQKQDVFLMIYAPWCGFCRKAMPIWGDFARKLAGEPGLVVAKLDG